MKLNLTPRFVLILLAVGLLPLLILAFFSLKSADDIGAGLARKLRSGSETTLEIIERIEKICALSKR